MTEIKWHRGYSSKVDVGNRTVLLHVTENAEQLWSWASWSNNYEEFLAGAANFESEVDAIKNAEMWLVDYSEENGLV